MGDFDGWDTSNADASFEEIAGEQFPTPMGAVEIGLCSWRLLTEDQRRKVAEMMCDEPEDGFAGTVALVMTNWRVGQEWDQ